MPRPFAAGPGMRAGPFHTGTQVINKLYDSVESAMADIHDGATILIGGFGLAGMPARFDAGLADLTRPRTACRA